MATIEPLSVASLFIEMFLIGAEKPIGIVTAFTIIKNKTCYLITNWHGVTGIHPATNQPLNKNGLCNPDVIKIWFSGKK